VFKCRFSLKGSIVKNRISKRFDFSSFFFPVFPFPFFIFFGFDRSSFPIEPKGLAIFNQTRKRKRNPGKKNDSLLLFFLELLTISIKTDRFTLKSILKARKT
jgi:hypothetical protein